MQRTPFKKLAGLLAVAATALVLVSCNGSSGPTGAAGTNGTNGTGTPGTPGSNGAAGTPAALNAAQFTSDQWSALKLSAKVQTATVTGGVVTATVLVTDNQSNPISGLAVQATGQNFPSLSIAPAVGSYPNFCFTLASLVPATATTPSRWMSPLVVGGTAAAPTLGFPEPNNTGTLVDNNNGTYTYTYTVNLSTFQSQASGVTLTGTQTLSDLDLTSYSASQPLRIGVSVGGGQPSTIAETTTTANTYYDFIPATGVQATAAQSNREVVAEASCDACHTKLSMHYPRFPGIQDPNLCVTCHTDQMKFGYPEDAPAAALVATPVPANGSIPQGTSLQNPSNTQKLYGFAMGNFPNMVHKIHMGSNLWYTGYNLHYTFNTVFYPQDVRNCTTCHTNGTVPSSNANVTPQGDNWFNSPSALACGACHDQTNLTTGLNHGPSQWGYPQDATCTTCHSAADIKVEHQPVLTPTQSGAAYYQATNPSNLPTGVHQVIAVVKSVSLVQPTGDTTDLGNPTITFSLYQDSVNAANILKLNTPLSTANIANLAMLTSGPGGTSYLGGPSLFFAMGLVEDGIAPADYNYEIGVPLVSLWNDTPTAVTPASGTQPAGTIPPNEAGTILLNADGSTTVTLKNIFVPFGTSTVIGGVGNGNTVYQSGLTQVGTGSDPVYNFALGVQVPIQTQWLPATFSYTVNSTTYKSLTRRTIVSQNACNDCHSNLGAFTTTAFHSAANNDATSCAICHNTVGASLGALTQTGSGNNTVLTYAKVINPAYSGHTASGYSINAKDWMHGLHAAGFRNYAYIGQGNFPGIEFPGILNNCEACHVPGSYNFANATNLAQFNNNNLLWDTMSSKVGTSATSSLYGSNGTPLPATGGTKVPANVAATSSAAGTSYQAPQMTATGASFGGGTLLPGQSIGNGFITTAAPGVPMTTTPDAATTLVTSPITAACTSCHDNQNWINEHMKPYGGVYYQTRASVQTTAAVTVNGVVQATELVNTETCLNCHGSGAQQDIATVHMNF
jgi:OmcA/MtrC family decaheme c-type cytochrome